MIEVGSGYGIPSETSRCTRFEARVSSSPESHGEVDASSGIIVLTSKMRGTAPDDGTLEAVNQLRLDWST